MVLALGAPTAPPAAPVESIAATPLPWHARDLEGTLDAGSHTEKEFHAHFDDAEAQRELDIARTLSQVSPGRRSAGSAAPPTPLAPALRGEVGTLGPLSGLGPLALGAMDGPVVLL